MLAILGWVLEGIEEIGTLMLWALESFANVLLGAIAAAYSAAIGLLPGMPSLPSLGTPSWLQWLNWIYPVGSLLAGLGVIVSMWIAFLAIRYTLRLVKAL